MLKFSSFLVCALLGSMAWAQAAAPVAAPMTAPPKVALLVYQQFLPGRGGARQTLEIDIARNFDRLAVPVSWIELESLTGPPQALFFDPASTFADLDKAGTAVAQLYATNPDLAQVQQRIDETVANSRTVTAFRRDDLSSHADSINLAKARYLRVQMVQINPARERDFTSMVASSVGTSKDQPARTWVAYQVNAGLPDLTFLFLETLRSMQDVDHDLAQASPGSGWLGSAASSEVNFFVIHPEMSHVSRDFAAADPYYWARPSP